MLCVFYLTYLVRKYMQGNAAVVQCVESRQYIYYLNTIIGWVVQTRTFSFAEIYAEFSGKKREKNISYLCRNLLLSGHVHCVPPRERVCVFADGCTGKRVVFTEHDSLFC